MWKLSKCAYGLTGAEKMDLLSLIGQLTKRREILFSQARELAKKHKNIAELEEKGEKDSLRLVYDLKKEVLNWQEYERLLSEKTLISALCSVILGSQSDTNETLNKAWPIIIGDILPPLIEFLGQSKQAYEQGLIEGDELFDFEESDKKFSWKGLLSRVKRYLSTPIFSFFSLGKFFSNQKQGFKEMKRIARLDSKTCLDCINFHNMGWRPIGSLPMPGRQCRCFDRCRCQIVYR